MATKSAFEVVSAALHGVVGWTLAAAVMSIGAWKMRAPEAALSAHAFAVPVAFLLVAFVYFRRAHPLRPPAAGLIFGIVALVLDATMTFVFARPLDARTVLLGTVLPALSAVVFSWLAGIASEITWSSVRRQ